MIDIERYSGFIITADGRMFLAQTMIDHTDDKGKEMTTCYCKARAESLTKWLKLGLLLSGDVDKNGFFKRKYPKYSLLRLGHPLEGGVQVFLCKQNFDGSDANLEELSNRTATALIEQKEMESEFWMSTYYALWEEHMEMLTQSEQYNKRKTEAMKPIKDFSKPHFIPGLYPQRLTPLRRMAPPGMPSEEEEE